MKSYQQGAFDLRSPMEPNEIREPTGQPTEGRAEGEVEPLSSTVRDLPTVIIDPALKEEADNVRESKRVRRRSKRPKLKTPIKRDDQPAVATSALSADDADRYANSIRPSWDPVPQGEKGEKGDNGSSAVRTAPVFESRENKETPAVWNPNSSAHGIPIQIPYQFSKKHFFWVFGSVAAVVALFALVILVSSGTDIGARAKFNRFSGSSSRQSVPKDMPRDNAAQGAIARDALPKTKTQVEQPSPASATTSSARTAATQPAVVPVRPTENAPEVLQQLSTGAISVKSAPAAPAVQLKAETKVRIRVETSPKKAQLYLDGAAVANPYDLQVNTSGSHLFEARLEGYGSATQTVDFNKDRLVYLSLSRAQREATASAASTKQVASVTSQRKTASRASAKQKSVRRARPTASPSKSIGAGFVSTNPY
jgi:hypothetical protein